MCDTFVALNNATQDGSVLFAKNSDRDPNEAQELVLIPAADHDPGDLVKCTYVEIPQVEHTYAVLLSKPFWMWGAEMGANEHGVAIGNEAVFTRVPMESKPGLIGMDFLRLALERGKTAEEALRVIISLLEQYGQSGNCGYGHTMVYHNSFIIADPNGAWVLETAGRIWAAEKVKDIRSISNALTIGSEWDLASPDLIPYAVEHGWCKNKNDFHFARCYSDRLYTPLSDASQRQNCSTTLLRQEKGRISEKMMMSVLRSHGLDNLDHQFRPDKGITGSYICMHAGFGPVRASQSVGSMISRLVEGENLHWVTGTAAPCTSIFKPVWMDAGLPDLGKPPGGAFDPASLFWRHEELHRAVMRNYWPRLDAFVKERDQLEEEFIEHSRVMRKRTAQERLAFSRACFERADQAEEEWLAKILHLPEKPTNWLYALAWRSFDRKAEFSHR